MMLPRFNIAGMHKWDLPASKSLSNRWLVANFLCGGKIELKNVSTAEDTVLMINLLQQLKEGQNHIFQCFNAGTVARFMTALLSVTPGSHVLTCSQRMKERPMTELIDALRSMGAKIRCLESGGHLPVAIDGRRLRGGEVLLSGNTSSQFASALLLVAPKMINPLTLKFGQNSVSYPYISMTCEVLRTCGHDVLQQPLQISVMPATDVHTFSVVVENDWSSAAYAYNLVAFSPNLSLVLPGLKLPSWQGDSVATSWYHAIGVETQFQNNGIVLTNNGLPKKSPLVFHCSDNPDLVPPLAVACAGLGLDAEFVGLQTLRYKESDRLTALATELQRLGCQCVVNSDSLHILPSQLLINQSGNEKQPHTINTYGDHRLAMSFATLACIFDGLQIDNPDVAAKSFPNFFWQMLKIKQL